MQQTYIEKAWAWGAARSTFTYAEMATATGLSLQQVRSAVHKLMRQGAVKETTLRQVEHFKGGFSPKVFKPVKGANPKLIGKGRHRCPKHRRGTLQQLVWQSMRIQRKFTVFDLSTTAECSDSTARTYIALLMKFGYVRKLPSPHMQMANEYRAGVHCQYRLVKDTGPHAPKRQGQGLYDANLGKEVSNVA